MALYNLLLQKVNTRHFGLYLVESTGHFGILAGVQFGGPRGLRLRLLHASSEV